MTWEKTGYSAGMSDAPDRDLQPAPTTAPLRTRRCNRCVRGADVLVLDERGLVSAACVDHLEWAFLTGVDAWTGRWRTG
jgi:hypothetical protein